MRDKWSNPSPRRRTAKKTKWLSEEALNNWENKRSKDLEEKERYIHLNAEFQRARRDKKAFLRDQWEEIEKNNRMGKTRDLFKKIRHTKGTFHTERGTIKNRDGKHLIEAEDVPRIHRRTIQKWSSWPRKSWWCNHSPRARHTGVQSQVDLRKHHYEQS